MLLLQQMLVLFIYMMLGFFLARKGVLDERAGKTFSWMVVNVANPALIILPTINKETTLSPEQIWEIGCHYVCGIDRDCESHYDVYAHINGKESVSDDGYF